MSTRPQIIAIVEDDPSMQKGIIRLLQAHGFATEIYASAEEFLATSSKASCIVIDICLGGMSGIELRRQLTASRSKLPVIFMTAVDDAGTQREAMEIGCLAYLHKPFAASLLIDAINHASV